MTIVPGTDQGGGRLPRRRLLGFLAGFSAASTAVKICRPIFGAVRRSETFFGPPAYRRSSFAHLS